MKKLKALLAVGLLAGSTAVMAGNYGIIPSYSNDIHPSDAPDYMHSHPEHEAGDHEDIHAPIMPKYSTDR